MKPDNALNFTISEMMTCLVRRMQKLSRLNLITSIQTREVTHVPVNYSPTVPSYWLGAPQLVSSYFGDGYYTT